MHFILSNLMIRVKQKDVFKEYDENLALDKQRNRLPAIKWIDPNEKEGFEASGHRSTVKLKFWYLYSVGWMERGQKCIGRSGEYSG